MVEYAPGHTRHPAGGRNRLAERLRSLRVGAWPGRVVTQRQLAQALGASAPLVSSWESVGGAAVPPVERLHAYARFFATERSVAGEPPRLVDLSELSDEEESRRAALVTELLSLRQEAVGTSGRVPAARSFWHYGDDEPIRVISTVLPQDLVSCPYASPWHPNYLPTIRNADMDSVLAVYGQIRAENPASKVTWVRSDQLTAEDFNSHVVILGGGDEREPERRGDPLTYYRRRLDLPVYMRPSGEGGSPGLGEEFGREYVVTVDEVGRPSYDGSGERVFRPRFLHRPGTTEPRHGPDGQPLLEYDVGLLARQPNAMNLATTVTVCSGIFSRGTFGVVRSVIDPQLREQNLARLGELVDPYHFWLLMYVPVFIGGEGLTTLTPDLSRPMHVLAHTPKEADRAPDAVAAVTVAPAGAGALATALPVRRSVVV